MLPAAGNILSFTGKEERNVNSLLLNTERESNQDSNLFNVLGIVSSKEADYESKLISIRSFHFEHLLIQNERI